MQHPCELDSRRLTSKKLSPDEDVVHRERVGQEEVRARVLFRRAVPARDIEALRPKVIQALSSKRED
jgi:hypothetical protein